MKSNQRIYIHPAPVRVWHWVNAVGFILLVLTGCQIRYAEMIDLLPLKDAIVLHNYVGFAVIINYFVWFTYYIGSGKIKSYIPDPRRIVSMAFKQLIYYGYGFFVGKSNPHSMTPGNKFNTLQQLTYLAVMLLLLPAQMVSGIFLWQVKGYGEYINLLGGIKVVDTIHVMIFFTSISFLFIHCYLITLGRTCLVHLKAMFTGYEELH